MHRLIRQIVANDPPLRAFSALPAIKPHFSAAFADEAVSVWFAELAQWTAVRRRMAVLHLYLQHRCASTAPFSFQDVHDILGHAAMINACGGTRTYQPGYWHSSKVIDHVLERRDFAWHLTDARIDAFLTYAIDLDLLAPDEAHTWRFNHSLLRDYFVYEYSLLHLLDARSYTAIASPARALVTFIDADLAARLVHARFEPRFLPDVPPPAARTSQTPPDAMLVRRIIGSFQFTLIIEHIEGTLVKAGVTALPPLITRLASPNPHIRAEVAELLGKIGHPDAVAALAHALPDPHNRVKWSVFHALQQIGYQADERAAQDERLPPGVERVDDDRKAWDKRFGIAGRAALYDAVEPLMSALSAKNQYIHGIAVQLLRDIGDVRAVDALIGALDDADAWVRGNAAAALGQMQDVRAVAPLISTLAHHHPTLKQMSWLDENGNARERAVKALSQFDDPRVVEPLIAALKDSNTGVRMAAAAGLRIRGDARAVEPLIQLLTDEATRFGGRVCAYAAVTLETIGTPAAREAARQWRRQSAPVNDSRSIANNPAHTRSPRPTPPR
jgi:HEAT repeat protein